MSAFIIRRELFGLKDVLQKSKNKLRLQNKGIDYQLSLFLHSFRKQVEIKSNQHLGLPLRAITNSLGQDVPNQNITQPEITLDLSTQGGNGLYFVHIVDPQGNTVDIRKIVLQ